MAKKRKQQFSVGTEESIADCLDRMKKEGYRPVRRMEKPVFKGNGSKTPVISHQQIIFEGILEEDEQ
ncbi:NETI motif-containing protein [Alkalicoccobacillus gibsonii]|uniref:NETI motif-containing protein n=1 Tax=Alkalicoccobacillus gibsonii TaxID=79881 RepID=A0ABU9VFC0_9BACI